MIMGQHAIHSLALGSIYALLAVGLTFMYGAQRSLAIAYGGLYAVGGYVAWWTVRSNRPLWVALGLAVLLCTLVGVLLHWGVRIARAHTAERSTLLGGLGGLICLGEVCRWVIGPYHMKVIAVDSHRIHHLGPLMVTDMHWLVFGCVFALFVSVQGFLTLSHSGRAVQALLTPATALASPPGDVSCSRLLACGLGAAMAGLSGVLAGLYLNDVYPAMGIHITHKMLSIVLIGVLGSLRGALLVAFGLALVEGVILPATRLPVPSEAVILPALALASIAQTWGRNADIRL